MKREEPTMKVDDLIKELMPLKGKDFDITFSGLDFYRIKQRADKLVQLEFNEQVYLDSQGLVVVDNLK